jgi:hypothetical protein
MAHHSNIRDIQISRLFSATPGSGVDEDAAEADQINVANLPPGTKTTFQVLIFNWPYPDIN